MTDLVVDLVKSIRAKNEVSEERNGISGFSWDAGAATEEYKGLKGNSLQSLRRVHIFKMQNRTLEYW